MFRYDLSECEKGKVCSSEIRPIRLSVSRLPDVKLVVQTGLFDWEIFSNNKIHKWFFLLPPTHAKMDLCVFNLSIFDCCIYISLQSQYPIYFIMLDFSVFLAPMHACSKALSSFLLLLYTLRQISLSLSLSVLAYCVSLSIILLTHSLPQPVTFPGWKLQGRACKQYIFWSLSIILLTHSLPQPVPFPGWKLQGHACKQYIFWSLSIILLTHSLPQPVTFPGWKLQGHACKQYIFLVL